MSERNWSLSSRFDWRLSRLLLDSNHLFNYIIKKSILRWSKFTELAKHVDSALCLQKNMRAHESQAARGEWAAQSHQPAGEAAGVRRQIDGRHQPILEPGLLKEKVNLLIKRVFLKIAVQRRHTSIAATLRRSDGPRRPRRERAEERPPRCQAIHAIVAIRRRRRARDAHGATSRVFSPSDWLEFFITIINL